MIKLNRWLSFLILVFPSVKMYAMSLFPVFDNVIDVLGVLSSLFLITMCCIRSRKLVVPKGCKYIFAFLALFLVSTMLNYPENLLGLMSEVSKILIIVLYLVLAFNSDERNFLKALDKLRKLYLVILIIDSLCLLVEILGFRIYENDVFTILGMDNYAAFSIIPMLSVVFYASYKAKGRIQLIDKLAFIGCLAAKITTFSFAAMLAMTVMAIVMIIALKGKQMRKLISPQFILLMIVTLIVGVVYFQADRSIDTLFAGTGKVLSNRTLIWAQTIKSLPKSPIIGFGYTTGEQFKKIAGFFQVAWESTQTHPHNYILAILFYTGIFGLLIYIGIFGQLVKAIRNNIRNKITAIVLGGIVGFLVLSIPDGYELLPSFYVFLTIVYLDNSHSKNMIYR